jgi:hypothetical protein
VWLSVVRKIQIRGNFAPLSSAAGSSGGGVPKLTNLSAYQRMMTTKGHLDYRFEEEMVPLAQEYIKLWHPGDTIRRRLAAADRSGDAAGEQRTGIVLGLTQCRFPGCAAGGAADGSSLKSNANLYPMFAKAHATPDNQDDYHRNQGYTNQDRLAHTPVSSKNEAIRRYFS